jgi:hypothetical protein
MWLTHLEFDATNPFMLWVPRISSTSCDRAIFVDHAAGSRAPSDTVLLKVNGFG